MLSTEAGHRRMFSVAALYNLTLGAVFLIFFSRRMTLFSMSVPPRELIVFLQTGILLAMVFGIGYQMVSHDPYGRMGIVILGIIGKIIVFLLFLYHFLFSGLHPVPFLVGVGDLSFALLFMKFLAFIRNETAGKTA